jgi:hypothetical protein
MDNVRFQQPNQLRAITNPGPAEADNHFTMFLCGEVQEAQTPNRRNATGGNRTIYVTEVAVRPNVSLSCAIHHSISTKREAVLEIVARQWLLVTHI